MAGTSIDRWVRRQSWTEPVSDAIQKCVGGFYGALGPPGRFLKNLAHGTLILRHPLHPALTDVPLGAWTVGVIADYVAHFNSRIPESAGDVALAVGLAVSVLVLITGYTDFHATFGLERRFAVLHGLIMTTVVAVDAASLALRWWSGENLHPLAIGLSTGAWGLLIAGAWFGGHVVFGTGTMVNRAAFLDGPEDWAEAGSPDDVPANGMHLVEAGGMQVVLARQDGRICALADVCSHAGGPLHEGTLVKGVVTCPWHFSQYRFRDGHVVGGPATFDQVQLDVREVDGKLQVKLTEPLH
jgi:nitrite reductase/ring-hydroxylating ferredoxin subunit/uncharacterized membrane protein